MKKKLLSVLVLFCVLSINNCTKEETLTLKLDYSKKDQWLYTIEYKSQGLFTQNDSTTQLTNGISCRLSGSTADAGKLTVKTEDIAVTSDMLNDEETQQLTEKLSNAQYSLNLVDGQPFIDTSAELPAGSFPEWDIYTQLAKLLPTLPDKPVLPGFTWERTVTLPIKTIQGTVPCEVYRSYTFDTLSANTALISWQFRYSAEEDALDSTNYLKQIPVAGNGSGTAQIDVKNNILLQAEMDFKTPVATIGEVTVNWQEHAVLKYEPNE